MESDDVRFYIFSVLNCLIVICCGQSHLNSQYLPGYQEYGPPTITRITHSAGKNLQLSCASGNLFQFTRNQNYFITWEFKSCGGKSIVPCQVAVKNQGIPACGKQIMHPCRKKLTIHKPKVSDSGIYTCQIQKKDTYEHKLIISMYQVEFLDKERNIPNFLGDEPKNKSVVVSHQVTFECRARSPLLPTSIRWLKRSDRGGPGFNDQTSNSSIISYRNFSYQVIQGHKITDSFYIKEAGPLTNDVYLSKLVIRKAEPQHSGHYACLAMNSVGINYREMYLTVLPLSAIKGVQRRPPELITDKPKNVSTVVPQSAVLECQVHSSLPPVVRWVRRVDHISFHNANISSSIEYINNSYQLLNWKDSEGEYYRYYIDETGPLRNDIYTSKLVFPATSVFDAGFYACVVMNDVGIIHREVFLNVVPVPKRKDESFAQMSLITLVLVPVTLIIVTLLVCYQKWRNYIADHQQPNQDYIRPRVYIGRSNDNFFHPIKINKSTSLH